MTQKQNVSIAVQPTSPRHSLNASQRHVFGEAFTLPVWPVHSEKKFGRRDRPEAPLLEATTVRILFSLITGDHNLGFSFSKPFDIRRSF